MGKIRAAVCREFNTPLTVEEVELRKPQTGEALKIPAKTVVKFRLAKAFKDSVVPPPK